MNTDITCKLYGVGKLIVNISMKLKELTCMIIPRELTCMIIPRELTCMIMTIPPHVVRLCFK